MIDEKKLIKDILQHEDVLKDANYVYKNGYETRQKEIIDIIERQPPVEAVPVVHGEWIGGTWYKKCSVCSEAFAPTTTLPNFCPRCGADMRKKVKHE